MKPKNQLNENDCLRAGIASLLNISPEGVPDFMEGDFMEKVEGPEKIEYPRWYLKVQEFLKPMGLCFVELPLPRNVNFVPLPFPADCLLIGRKQEGGKKHITVGRVGHTYFLDHDPAGGDGIENVEAIAFLMPLDIENYMERSAALERIDILSSQPRKNLTILHEIRNIAAGALQKPLIQLLA